MSYSRQRLAAVVARESLKSGLSKKLAKEVASTLMVEHKTNDLQSLIRDVQADWAAAGYVNVVVSSAHELSNSTQRYIRSLVKKLYPKAKQVILTSVYDPEVVGGVRLNFADQQLDVTIEAKLNKFREYALKEE